MFKEKIKTVIKASSVLLCFSLISCANDNRTAGRRLDDMTLLVRVEKAIHDDKKLPHSSKITVNSYKNIIQLSGFVQTQWEKEEAQRAAESVKTEDRVYSVINSIIVEGTEHSYIKHKAHSHRVLRAE